MIDNPPKDKLCSIIQFLTIDWCQPMEIYMGMKDENGDNGYFHTAMVEWCNKF